MAATWAVNWQVTNGPSKFDLMLALFEGKEVSFKATQLDYCNDFEVKGTETLFWVAIAELKRGKKNHEWEASGTIVRHLDSAGKVKSGPRKEFKIEWYSDRIRKGILTELQEKAN